eukprot:TRINITY_DN315_c1_g1_i1.p1 TRINITY_DN315_c1_g1~~TRINITY_DN315_c1_g1_i1.p1  ORF type:complete len:144 (+),score=50.52 TRINITY_DN315_c1_g1_i1:46-432(+)
MKVNTCIFSGLKIYPGHGTRYVRGDSKTFIFLNAKSESLFHQRKNPRKISWTAYYRITHKKGESESVTKKRTKKTKKFERAIVGASLDDLRKKRDQNPSVRKAARDSAIRAIKEANKKGKKGGKKGKK